MNALARILTAPSPSGIPDGWRDSVLDNYGWRIRFGYNITQYGKPNAHFALSGDPYANGIPHEVEIVRAILVTHTDERELCIANDFTREAIQEHEDTIALELDEAQSHE